MDDKLYPKSTVFIKIFTKGENNNPYTETEEINEYLPAYLHR